METNRGILSNNRPLTEKVLRNSPILAKWLMKIFILHLAYTILDGINNDYTQPFLGKFATVISVAVIILQVLTALCFIKLEPTDRRFRTTGVLTLILAVFSVFSMVIVYVPGLINLAIFATIGSLVVSLLNYYYMIKAYANVVEDADIRLSRKWDEIWKWYVISILMALGGTLLIILIPLLGVILTAIGTIAMLVLSIMTLVFQYKSAKLYITVDKKINEQKTSAQ
ncbi:MAG: hypothetical protein ILP17_10620 [Lachnospiraceae bacterium]|nr:hypothetical protein [Lachnospiraceae bacterium]